MEEWDYADWKIVTLVLFSIGLVYSLGMTSFENAVVALLLAIAVLVSSIRMRIPD